MKLLIEQAQRFKKIRIQSEITQRVAVTQGKDNIPSPSGGRQMGLVQQENHVVFYIHVPRETERQQRKKWRTQEYLTSNQL